MMQLEEQHYADLIGTPFEEQDCRALTASVLHRMGFTGDLGIGKHVDPSTVGSFDRVPKGEEKPGDVAGYSRAGDGRIDHVAVLLPDGKLLHALEGKPAGAMPRSFLQDVLVSFYRPRVAPPVDFVADRQAGKVVIRIYRNVLDTSDFEDVAADFDGGPVLQYIPEEYDPATLQVSVNGGPMTSPAECATVPRSGDVVAVVVMPGVAIAGLPAIASTIISFVVTSAISIGVGLLIQALTAPPQPDLEQRPIEENPTFSQGGIRNTFLSGGTIPIVFGKHRIGGHVIGSYNSITDLVVADFAGGTSGVTDPNAGPDSLIQITNGASASGGKTYLNWLIALSEGEIESINGLTTDSNAVAGSQLAPGTLLVNGNDASDYEDISISVRMGKTDQQILPGFTETANAVAIEQVVAFGQPFTTTTTQVVDAFEIQLFCPNGQFRLSSGNGSTKVKEVFYEFRFRPEGATAWTEILNIERQLIKRGAFSWSIRRDNLPRGKYEIYLERLTEDDDDPIFVNAQEVSTTQINAINEITEDGTAYGGIAVMAVRALATDQLNGLPVITSLVEGKKWWVYDPTISGSTPTNPDFTFKYTRNPGEQLQGLLLNKTFGLGEYIGVENIDWAAMKELADECDTTIDDGRGGTITRYTFDGNYDRAEKAGDWVQKMLTVARATLVARDGQISVVLDKAKSATHLIGEGNLQGAKVSYLDTSNRPTRVNVTFANEELQYDIDTVSVEDSTVTDGEFRAETVTAIGITHPARAMRMAQYRLNQHQTIAKTLEGTAPLDSILMEIGDVFWAANSELSTGHTSGRIVSADSLELTLDRDVDVTVDQVMKVRVMSTATGKLIQQERTLNIATTETVTAGTAIAITVAWDNIPEAQDVYAIGIENEYVSPFILINAPLSGSLTRQITAIGYDATIYDDDPGTVPASTDDLYSGKLFPSAVTGVRAVEETRTTSAGEIRQVMAVSWSPNHEFEESDVFYRQPLDEGNAETWVYAGRGIDNVEVDAFGLSDVLEFSVVPISPDGNRKHPKRGTKANGKIRGKLVAPSAVSGFKVVAAKEKLTFSWDEPTEKDIAKYEIRVGEYWLGSTLIGWVPKGSCTYTTDLGVPGGTERTYHIKAHNSSGIVSQSSATASFSHPIKRAVHLTDNQEPGWAGSLTNFTLVGSNIESDSGASSATYVTSTIDIGASWFALPTVYVAVQIEDRSSMTINDATFMFNSAEARARQINDGIIRDIPDTYVDAASTPINSATFAINGNRFSMGRTVGGGRPEDSYTVTLEMKTGTTTIEHADASYEPYVPETKDYRYISFRLTVNMVDGTAFNAVVSEFESSHYAMTPVPASFNLTPAGSGLEVVAEKYQIKTRSTTTTTTGVSKDINGAYIEAATGVSAGAMSAPHYSLVDAVNPFTDPNSSFQTVSTKTPANLFEELGFAHQEAVEFIRGTDRQVSNWVNGSVSTVDSTSVKRLLGDGSTDDIGVTQIIVPKWYNGNLVLNLIWFGSVTPTGDRNWRLRVQHRTFTPTTGDGVTVPSTAYASFNIDVDSTYTANDRVWTAVDLSALSLTIGDIVEFRIQRQSGHGNDTYYSTDSGHVYASHCWFSADVKTT